MAEIPNWDSTANNNNQASPNGWPEGMPPSGVNDSARENMAAVRRFWARVNGTMVTTGGPSTFSISYSITPSALTDGEVYAMKFHTAVADAPQLVIKGYTAKNLFKPTQAGIVSVSASDIVSGQRIVTQYDSSLDGFVIVGGGVFGGPPQGAEYLVASADASLPNARVLTAGAGLTATASASADALTVAVDYGKSGTYAAQQVFGTVSLSDSTTISWDLTAAQVAAVTLGNSTRTMTFSNQKNGGCYVLRVVSGGSSSSLTIAGSVKWPGGTKPTFTKSAGATDVLTFHSDGTTLFGVASLDFG